MIFNLFNCRPVTSVISEHLYNQVLEVIRQVVALNFVEVLLVLPCYDQVEEIFVLSRFLEREYASNDYEEDDAGGEDIGLPPVVQLALLDFGSHVRHCPAVGL